MKKIITTLALSFTITFISAQIFTADFETFSLSTSSFYKDTNSVPFSTENAIFRHQWTNGTYPTWSGGFSYTNKYDSSTAGYSNLYGVKPFKGYNGSNTYIVGQNKGTIVLDTSLKSLDGFYITNTTYAYKSMKFGDGFAKKFGGATGNDADFFKVIIRGYLGGIKKNDSVAFYLADFRFSNNALDYIIDNWQWVNTSNLGKVDSVIFIMYSSDIGQYGINTPMFFAIDNFTTDGKVTVIAERNDAAKVSLFPNPVNSFLTIMSESYFSKIQLTDLFGKVVYTRELNEQQALIDLSTIEKGIYFLELSSGQGSVVKKLVKN